MTNPQARNRMQRRRVMRTLLLCGLCLLGAGVARASAQNAVNGTIRGRVIDETSELGIASVLVEFLDSYRRVRASAMTDDDGEFLLSRTPRGSFRIRVTRLGYARTVTPVWEVESGETLTVIVRMHPDAVLMAPLEITASTRSASPVMANFYHRLQRGVGGVYITRADIEQRNPGLVTDLLRTVPGVRLSDGVVHMARALPGVGGGANGCPVQIWVDGILATRGRGGNVSPDWLATPGTLEGIEVHRGLSTVPPEFLSPEARCGVIALWTRRGG
jgi:hypothetical protein